MHASGRFLKGWFAGCLKKIDRDGIEGYSSILQHGVIGEGSNDYDPISSILKSVNFKGWISIEDGVEPQGGIERLARSATFLRAKCGNTDFVDPCSWLFYQKPMSRRVEGKTAIVTGAAQGIGKGIAIALAEGGANVVISDIQVEPGEALAAHLQRSGCKVRFVRADVESEEDCSNLVKQSVEYFSKLDVLVNNAGYFPRVSLEETTTEMWEKVLRINLRGPFYCAKHAIPAMRRAGGGSIVNIGSINGIQALPTLVAYGAAKGGLLALTRTLANAYAKDRIRVNYIIPGWVLTEGEIAIQRAQGVTLEQLEQIGHSLRFGRFQTPEDTAHAVLYLASDESAQMTGAILHLDAGASTLPAPRG